MLQGVDVTRCREVMQGHDRKPALRNLLWMVDYIMLVDDSGGERDVMCGRSDAWSVTMQEKP